VTLSGFSVWPCSPTSATLLVWHSAHFSQRTWVTRLARYPLLLACGDTTCTRASCPLQFIAVGKKEGLAGQTNEVTSQADSTLARQWHTVLSILQCDQVYLRGISYSRWVNHLRAACVQSLLMEAMRTPSIAT